MTPKGHGVIRGRRDLLYDPKGQRWPLTWSVWPSLWPKKVTGSLEVAMTYFMTRKVNGDLCGRFDLVYDLKRSWGHLEVALTYFMTPKVTRWHYNVIRLWRLVPWLSKGHVGSSEVAGTYSYDWQRSRWPLWSVWPSLWPQKVTGSIRGRREPTLWPQIFARWRIQWSWFEPKFLTSNKVNDSSLRFSSLSDLLYDSTQRSYLSFDLDLDLRSWPPKGHGVISPVAMTLLLLTPKVNLTFDLDLDPRVKYLTWQVTTDVQVTL